MTRPRILILAILSIVLLLAGVQVAMADHSNPPLNVTLKAKPGKTLATDGYSPKQTCGGCHIDNCILTATRPDNLTKKWCETEAQRSALNSMDDYAQGSVISSHAEGRIVNGKVEFGSVDITSPVHGVSSGKHSQMGRNEGFTGDQRAIWGVPATSSSPGMWGRYCPPSNRILSNSQASNAANIDLDTQYWAKNCGGCHVGGGFMEYDRNMANYGALSLPGDRFTFVPSKPGTPWQIVDIATSPAMQATAVWGDNNTEVDCMMCHMDTVKAGAAWYKTAGCDSTNPFGPSFAGGMMGMFNPAYADFGAHDPDCSGNDMYGFNFVGNPTTPGGIPAPVPGTFYDMFNRGHVIFKGWFGKAATAGLGVRLDSSGNLNSTDLAALGGSISGSRIASNPNSENCGQCHARNEGFGSSIPVPGNSAVGGMKLGYGVYWRREAANTQFDIDKITAAGACGSGDCSNSTLWSEFGCKTGMGKRSQRVGAGVADKWSLGICAGCNMFTTDSTWMINAMTGANSGFCSMPSVQAMCDALNQENGGRTTIGIGQPIPNKMPDYDIHDIAPRNGTVVATGVTKNKGEATGIKCADCHYFIEATPEKPIHAKTITANVGGTTYTYTYPENTDVKEIDHMFAQGNQILEKSLLNIDGTASCESCHTTLTNPNLVQNGGTLITPVPTHSGFPAIHLQKIDCRTCHIPQMYNSPGRLLSRDWSAGPYRLMDGGNGNPNHFEFSYNFASGNMNTMPLLRNWSTFNEEGVAKIVPQLVSTIIMWNGASVRASDNFVLGWAPAKQRDVGISAALASASEIAAGRSGIRINGTNDHPPFDGFQLTDPFKVNRDNMIKAVAAELGTDRSTATNFGKHSKVTDPRLNLMPLYFDPSHGVTAKEYALGGTAGGGCVSCHSSSIPCLQMNADMTCATPNPSYSSKSIGFFDNEHETLKNLMSQFADYDCGEPGWNNATQPTYCAMFDGAISGLPNGTCEDDEQGACKAYVVNAGFAQVTGYPAINVSQYGVRMDGLDFMGVFAIREGGHDHGCDPRFQLFGMDISAACSTNGNPMTGTCSGPCDWGYMYSRQEIRDHYQIRLQQSTFPTTVGGSWVNPITNVSGPVPTTMNRVYGIAPFLAKNPMNPNHANKFDMGKICWKNPMMGANCGDPTGCEKTCGEGDFIKTSVNANTLLGYTPEYQACLMGLVVNPLACSSKPVAALTTSVADGGVTVTFYAGASLNATSYSWNFGDGATGTGVTVDHTYALGTYEATLTAYGPYGVSTKTVPITIQQVPVAAYTTSVSNLTVTFNGTASLNAASYAWNFGDGSPVDTTSGAIVAHLYTAGTYNVSLTVTSASGNTSTKNGQITVGKLVPTCAFNVTYDPSDLTKRTIIYDATASINAGTYEWTFGDGSPVDTTSGVKATHLYGAANTYYPSLKVTSPTGQTCTKSSRIILK